METGSLTSTSMLSILCCINSIQHKLICRILFFLFEVRLIDVQHQSGSSDCSLFPVAFAQVLCAGLDPTWPHSTRRACGSIYFLHLRMESSCHFPLHRDRGAWEGEESCGSGWFQSTVPADCPGTKRMMPEDHLSHATFATSGFIETAKIFQT